MRFALLNFLFWITASLAFAEVITPLTIQADSASFNRSTGISIYEGHVIATSGKSRLLADKIVAFSDHDNHVTDLIATGKPVYYEPEPLKNKPPIKAHADTLKYHVKENTIELIGNAYAEQGKDHIEGSHLLYHLSQHILESWSSTVMVINPSHHT